MASRKTTRRLRRGRARWLPWSPVMAEWFRLAATDWKTPPGVHLTQGQHQQTLTAKFTRPDGAVMTARLRLRRDAHSGAREIVSEELSMGFVLRVEGADG